MGDHEDLEAHEIEQSKPMSARELAAAEKDDDDSVKSKASKFDPNEEVDSPDEDSDDDWGRPATGPPSASKKRTRNNDIPSDDGEDDDGAVAPPSEKKQQAQRGACGARGSGGGRGSAGPRAFTVRLASGGGGGSRGSGGGAGGRRAPSWRGGARGGVDGLPSRALTRRRSKNARRPPVPAPCRALLPSITHLSVTGFFRKSRQGWDQRTQRRLGCLTVFFSTLSTCGHATRTRGRAAWPLDQLAGSVPGFDERSRSFSSTSRYCRSIASWTTRSTRGSICLP